MATVPTLHIVAETGEIMHPDGSMSGTTLEEVMNHIRTQEPPTQLQFPGIFTFSLNDFGAFLARYTALEDAKERLAEDMTQLKKEYADALPLRGVLAAVKIVRTRRKLAEHPKEPLQEKHLAYLESLVEQHMDARVGLMPDEE